MIIRLTARFEKWKLFCSRSIRASYSFASPLQTPPGGSAEGVFPLCLSSCASSRGGRANRSHLSREQAPSRTDPASAMSPPCSDPIHPHQRDASKPSWSLSCPGRSQSTRRSRRCCWSSRVEWNSEQRGRRSWVSSPIPVYHSPARRGF